MTTDAEAGLLTEWADRVRANREQVDRVREVPDGADFYGPATSLFRADPDRADDPSLPPLLALARPGDTWLDIGAGAGRYALPLARRVREVIAVDPSAGMLGGLREAMAEHGISNVHIVESRWPVDDPALAATLRADVALIAHVSYDIEAIGPFLDAMEAAASRSCAALLMDRQPSSVADPFWPPIHGEARISLPALHEFVALLEARGRRPAVEMVERRPRVFASREELERFVRRQLWIAPGGEKDRRFVELLAERVVEVAGGFGIAGGRSGEVGFVTWTPR